MAQDDDPQLTALAEFPLAVRCSPGTEERARRLAGRCAEALGFLRQTLGYGAEARLLVLGPDQWEAHTGSPMFGVPQTVDERTVVVAGRHSALWDMIVPPPEALPAHAQAFLSATYGGPGGGLSIGPYMDLLPVHELGHLFVDQRAGRFDHHAPRRWVVELFCNLCLHAYVAMREPGQLPYLEVFPRVVAEEAQQAHEHRSLAAFEALYAGMEPPNFVWYLSRLHVAAKGVYEAAGVAGLARLYEAIVGAEAGQGDEALAARLAADVHPAVAAVLTAW